MYLIIVFILFVSYVFRHLALVCCLTVEKKKEKIYNKEEKERKKRKQKEKRKTILQLVQSLPVLRPASRETWICFSLSLSNSPNTLFVHLILFQGLFICFLITATSTSCLLHFNGNSNHVSPRTQKKKQKKKHPTLFLFIILSHCHVYVLILHFNGNNHVLCLPAKKKKNLTPHSFCSSYFILSHCHFYTFLTSTVIIMFYVSPQKKHLSPPKSSGVTLPLFLSPLYMCPLASFILILPSML